MNQKSPKKKWEKPKIKCLKFNKTLGGPYPSDPEGIAYSGSV